MSFISCRLKAVLSLLILHFSIFLFWALILYSLQGICQESTKHQLAVDASNALATFDKIDFSKSSTIILNYESDRLGLKGQARKKYQQEFQKAITHYIAGLLIEERMKFHSSEELRAIVEHYNTFLGKKITEKAPLVDEFRDVVAEPDVLLGLFSKEELAYEQSFHQSPIGQSIAKKVEPIRQSVRKKMYDKPFVKMVNDFNADYFTQKKKPHG